MNTAVTTSCSVAPRSFCLHVEPYIYEVLAEVLLAKIGDCDDLSVTMLEVEDDGDLLFRLSDRRPLLGRRGFGDRQMQVRPGQVAYLYPGQTAAAIYSRIIRMSSKSHLKNGQK